jgi:hypothetical protein
MEAARMRTLRSFKVRALALKAKLDRAMKIGGDDD